VPPRPGRERALGGDRRCDGIRSQRKDSVDAVTRRLDDMATVRFDGSPQHFIVTSQRRLHTGIPFPQARRTLKVRE
jgi:hypothetical protein